MGENRIDQGGAYALLVVTPAGRVDQGGAYSFASVTPAARVDQSGVYGFVAVKAVSGVTQAGVYALASGSPCASQWCQIWTITRSDGETYRFTSLDRKLEWGGQVYQACDSLVPSASEGVSEVDAAGSMDLSGAIGPGGISELALFAGLLDGARAEAWLVPWAGKAIPRLLLRGTFGPVEHGKTGFRVELLGDGAKLLQTPLVRRVQPGCRYLFGDALCGKDLAPLRVAGSVTGSTGQRAFTDSGRGEAPGYFSRGRVTFTSGMNAGISAEIKEHAAGGRFTLWPRLAFPIVPGVTYEMTPGCTNLKAAANGTNGCSAWGNAINYGGEDKVPTGDKSKAAANVRTN